jgi:nitroimidazol reductase NimA-like FMN-containing flavoprotein (pyridoxamine 5'-phosphate oxidase superfamily)/nucleotide-binding universal stress UspA family protein
MPEGVGSMQPIRRILVATDLSELSAAAMRAAVDQARSSGAELQVLHVAASRQAQPNAVATLRDFIRELDGGIRIVPSVRVGSAAEEIVRCAEEGDARLIVMGRHGHTGATGVLLGSVAECVARTSRRPVLLVPPEVDAHGLGMGMDRPRRAAQFYCLRCGAPSEYQFCAACRAHLRMFDVPAGTVPLEAPAGALSAERIETLLERSAIGRLGCHAEGRTYVVPMGYAYAEGLLYLRSAEGTKARMMRENPNVCFQVDHIQSLADWESVIVFGVFRELQDRDAVDAMQRIHDRLASLVGDEDVWPRPSEALADDRLGHRASTGGRSAVVGYIESVEKTGRRQIR